MTDMAEIDEMLSSGEPKLAEQFLQTVEQLIEALQLVSEARGLDDEDDFARATNCVRWMQGVAFDALIAAGLKPRGRLIDDSEPSTATHEAAHAVTARKLGVAVLHASAADGDPHVRTRFRTSQLAEDATVALAGLAVDYSVKACEKDLRNAIASIERLTRLRHGIAMDAALPDAQRGQVTQTVARLREKAKTLVEQNWNSIERVADALSKGPLKQADIDRLIVS